MWRLRSHALPIHLVELIISIHVFLRLDIIHLALLLLQHDVLYDGLPPAHLPFLHHRLEVAIRSAAPSVYQVVTFNRLAL